MKFMIALIASILLVTSCASAAGIEAPPDLTLNADGVIETPVKANYSWEYPTGNQDEWSDVEACGMAPTDPTVWETFDHVFLTEDRTYALDWNGYPPDEVLVFSWDIGSFTDQDNIDGYQQNTETLIHPANGKITLKPNRIYDFQAKWEASEGEAKAHGLANYYLVTEELMMYDGPGSVMVGGWMPAPDSTMTDDLKTIFDKGMASCRLDGAVTVPVAYLGSQVVAGTNHAFLCQTKSAYSGAEAYSAYVIVYLYEDLQGNVSVLNIADFDVGSLCTYGAN